MTNAVQAYRHVSASEEFREIERKRSMARHDEAQALLNARRQATEMERRKWQGVVSEQAAKNEQLGMKNEQLGMENEELRLQLAELIARFGDTNANP